MARRGLMLMPSPKKGSDSQKEFFEATRALIRAQRKILDAHELLLDKLERDLRNQASSGDPDEEYLMPGA